MQTFVKHSPADDSRPRFSPLKLSKLHSYRHGVLQLLLGLTLLLVGELTALRFLKSNLTSVTATWNRLQAEADIDNQLSQTSHEQLVAGSAADWVMDDPLSDVPEGVRSPRHYTFLEHRVRRVVPFSLDAVDAETATWQAAVVDAVPAAVRRAGRGEAHAVQREMLPYVADMLDHALHGYFTHAFPHDDLLSLTGGHGDSFGGVGITLLDSLDMLALAGRHRTFRRAARWVEAHLGVATQDVAASAFEVNIRAMGGLLAAHYVYEEGMVPVVRGEHDYGGGLLRMARELGERLMRVFDSPTGLPFPSINLRRVERKTDRSTTTNADAGSFMLEFGSLSRLTGNSTFGYAARRAAQILHDMREPATQLMNLWVDLVRGDWNIDRGAGIGACIDSTIEYAVKHHVLSGEVQEWREYEADRRAASGWLRQGGFYYGLSQADTLRVDAVTQGLSAFYPGNMALGGHHAEAAEGVWAVHGLAKRAGTLAEVTELRSGTASVPRYQLRPEHAESLYYLYRATHDPVYLAMGRELAVGLQLHTRVPYGFAVLSMNDRGYRRRHLVDYMESFLIAETLKYLYLLFDEASAVHAAGVGVGAVGWVFTTEAHVVPNTWEQWGLDAVSVRTGLRGPPVRPAYTAFMFNTSASRLGSEEAAVQASEADLMAEAAPVKDRWLFHAGLRDPLTRESANWTSAQWYAFKEAQWETEMLQYAARTREVYRRRRTHATQSVGAARRRHVLGLLCAVHGRLRRVRGGAAGRAGATALRRTVRELRLVCAGCGPVLHTPLHPLPSAPFARADVVSAVHRRYSDGVTGGAYEYACEVAHLRGVRQLSRGVYHPAVSPNNY